MPFKLVYFCFLNLFFITACGGGDKSAVSKKLIKETSEESKKLYKQARAKEVKLRKKARQADIQGTATPLTPLHIPPNSLQRTGAYTPQTTPQKTNTEEPAPSPVPSPAPPPPALATPQSPAPPSILSVCQRPYAIQKTLLDKLKKNNCGAITLEDLQSVVVLELVQPYYIVNGNRYIDHSRPHYTIRKPLKKGDFDGFSSLEILIMKDHDFETLPEGLFDDLISLKLLGINSNVTFIHPKVFSQLTALEDLDLWFSYYVGAGIDPIRNNVFTAQMFKNLPSLKSLSLRSTFTVMPVLEGLPSLNSLQMSSDFLTTILEGTFDNLPSLTSLNISGFNKLETLPENIFNNLPSLTSLRLNRNPKLTALPLKLLSPLTALEEVHLTFNNSINDTLPPGFFLQAPSLKLVNLAYTLSPSERVRIKKEVGALPQIKYLYIGANELIKY